VSSNQAQNGGSWAFRTGFDRSHNPSAVGSSPTCPTGVSAGHRPAIRRTPLEIIPGQSLVAHQELESAGRGSSGTCPTHVCAGQAPRLPPGTLRGQGLWHICGTRPSRIDGTPPTVIGANSDELKPRHKGSLARPERRRHDPRSQVAEQPDEPSRHPDVLRRVRPDTAIAEGTQGKADRLHQRSGAARHRSARLPPRSRTSGRDHRPHPMRAPASWPGHVR